MPALEFAQMLTIVTVVVFAFVATSMDNLLIQVVLLGVTGRRGPVIAAMLASTATVMLASASALLVGGWLSPDVVGSLGLIPIGLGLLALWRGHGAVASEEELHPGAQSNLELFGGSFLLLLGNSGDSLAVFFPLIAESTPKALLFGLVVWGLVALAWILLALRLADNRQLARFLDERGARLVPWVMIAVGVYILFNTATDSLA